MRVPRFALSFVLSVSFCASLIGCATTKRDAPIYVIRVERGDTLAGIAMKYDTDWRQIAALNRLPSGTVLRPGQILRVRPGPGGHAAGMSEVAPSHDAKRAKAPRGTSNASDENADNAMFEEAARELEGGGKSDSSGKKKQPAKRGLFFGGTRGKFDLSWPLTGELSSRYGKRGRSFHYGIDIRAPKGTAVAAAGDGYVEFAGVKRGYGRLVIIRHRGVKTFYGHLSSIEVSKGENVMTGRLIGEVGATGNATGPHLHFEIRDARDKALDPLKVLEETHLVSSL